MTSVSTDAGATAAHEAARLRCWMECHRVELLRHLTGMLGSGDDAEDVLQHVWIRALERPPELGAGSNVRAWLYRVGTNLALDRMATERRRRGLLCGRPVRPESVPPVDAGLLGASERIRAAVRRRTSALPPQQRAAVWYRWVEEQDYDTIARKLDTTVQSARASVYQGLKRLRAELAEEWEQENRA